MHKKVLRYIGLLLLLAFFSRHVVYGFILNREVKPYTKTKDNFADASADTTDLLNENYAVYTISVPGENVLLQVSGNIYYNQKYEDNRKILLSKSGGSHQNVMDWQRFHIIYESTDAGIRYYHIRNVFSGKLLEVPEQQDAFGITLQQNHGSADLADRQLWYFHKSAKIGQFFILNKATAMAVTVSRNRAATLDSREVVMRPIINSKSNNSKVTSSENQVWSITLQPDQAYRDDEVVRFFNRNKPSQGSVAFDQGNSIPLSWGPNKGKVLWVTQDAWDGSSLQPNNKFKCTDYFRYRNSILIQPSHSDWNPDNTFNISKQGSVQNKPLQICDIIPNAEYAWPSQGVEIANHVYLLCGEGNGLGPAVSQSLYDLTEDTNSVWKVRRTIPPGMSTETRINYAAGMVKSSDGFVYVYGTEGIVSGYGTNVYVARFLISDPQSWTFWNGSSWVDKPVAGDTARIAEELGTATVAYVHGKYVMITMDQGFNCDTARNIYAAVSDKPNGPFTKRTKVYSITEYFNGKFARYYTPAIHPEFDNGRNELLVTYCLNFSACGLSECVDGYQDPYYYRVKAIRIPFSKIGL